MKHSSVKKSIVILKSSGKFLLEFLRWAAIAVVVGCIGGVIGIILGIIFSAIGGSLLDINAAPSVGAIAISFTISAGIGVAFWFLPAKKAA